MTDLEQAAGHIRAVLDALANLPAAPTFDQWETIRQAFGPANKWLAQFDAEHGTVGRLVKP